MLESGSSGSVRGASRNGRPYREPQSIWHVRQAVGEWRCLRIADMRRERLNVADRRQAEWGAGLEVFEEKRS
jgi:hypothetical protein